MNIEVYIRLYEELNDFLPPDLQKKDFAVHVPSSSKVRQLLNIFNVPSSKVDLILVNGESAEFDYQLNNGDRVSIYPVFETFNIAPVSRLHKPPLRELRFICDVHLGKLAKYMRMLGFDVFYNHAMKNLQLIESSRKENRIILTKDKKLLKNHLVTRAYQVKESEPQKQLSEIVTYFDLSGSIDPLSRCLQCNERVQPVTKESVKNIVPIQIFTMHDSFKQCENCNRIYWMGSHYRSMMNGIRRI